jgi:integrase
MVTDGMINRSYANDLKVLMIEGQPTRTWAKDDLDKLFSRDNLIGKSGIASQQSNQESLPLVMVLLLYTGARLDELCYVKTSDYFRRDPNSDGVIPTLIIQRSEERRIKTPFSIRKIPLHDHLAKLGILDYFEQRIVEGKKYLLDVPTKGGSKGNSLTQRFGSYRDNMGWKAGKGRSLRSFRKTINTALTGKSDSDDRYRMLGHSMGTVNDKNYTERLEISLDRIHSDLCGVTFGLDLDALRAVLERFVPNYPKRS